MIPVNGVLLESGIDLGPLLPHHLSEVVVGIILMLLVFLVMWKAVVPAFEKLYEERYQRIEGGIQRAEQAEAKVAEYNDQLNSAREEAAKIREEAKNTSAQMLAEARERASKEADRILAAGRAQLEAERSQLLAELRGDIGGLATTLASRIVGEALTDDERANRTIDRFMHELETAGTSR